MLSGQVGHTIQQVVGMGPAVQHPVDDGDCLRAGDVCCPDGRCRQVLPLMMPLVGRLVDGILGPVARMSLNISGPSLAAAEEAGLPFAANSARCNGNVGIKDPAR